MSADRAASGSLYRDANFIANEWVDAGDGSFTTVLDKYSGTELARLPNATKKQMELAIQSAADAFGPFRKWSSGKRAAGLEKLGALIAENGEELARLIVQEGGKPISYARNEITRCVTTVKTAAAEALRFSGETVPLDFDAGQGKIAFTTRIRLGQSRALRLSTFHSTWSCTRWRPPWPWGARSSLNRRRRPLSVPSRSPPSLKEQTILQAFSVPLLAESHLDRLVSRVATMGRSDKSEVIPTSGVPYHIMSKRYHG